MFKCEMGLSEVWVVKVMGYNRREKVLNWLRIWIVDGCEGGFNSVGD